MAYVGDVVPYERRQPVLARFLAGQMCGMIAGQVAGGVIGDHFGWRTVFYRARRRLRRRRRWRWPASSAAIPG